MEGKFQLKSDQLVVLIDAENANPNLIEPLLKEVAKYGTAYVKRIYGDWTNTNLNSWKKKLHKFAIQPIQQFRYTTGKNATDSALIIDAMDLLYTRSFDGFCIVSSDSDFTRLASRIRESGLGVYGFGERKTPEAFVSACDKFIYTEILEAPEDSKHATLVAISPSDNKDLSHIVAEVPPAEANINPPVEINNNLLKLLQDAYESVASDDGWANLGPFGAQLTKLSPSFDSRNYGYKKLGDLVHGIQIFIVKEVPHSKNPAIKELYVKVKD